jgi:hypothetical protein
MSVLVIWFKIVCEDFEPSVPGGLPARHQASDELAWCLQVLVQNRVAIAEATLPDIVRAIGVTTKKRSPDILLGC